MAYRQGYINTRHFGGSRAYFCVSVLLKDALSITQSILVQTMFYGMEQRVVWQLICVASGYRRSVHEICDLLGCYATCTGKLPLCAV
jgi:hypothetical protein